MIASFVALLVVFGAACFVVGSLVTAHLIRRDYDRSRLYDTPTRYGYGHITITNPKDPT